jgi:large subunit ribosomal protein L10
MSKKIKQMLVEDLRARLGQVREVLVVDSSRLDGIAANTLRLKLHKQSIRMLGVKNSLARQALTQLGLGSLEPYLTGPSVLVFGGPDIVALSKEITKWAKEIDKLVIKGGIVEGKSIDAQGVVALSKSPSREELLSMIVGQVLSPGARLAALVTSPAATLASQVKTIAEKEAEAPAAG